MQGSEPAADPPVPARGTRPRNRRAQIRTSATELFYEHGYAQVSVADVADSVNIGPSALYRHFSGKAELLFEALLETTNAFAAAITDLPRLDLDGMARVSAQVALAHRQFGVLWQREARNLEPAQRGDLRRQLRVAVSTLAGTLRSIRPELDIEQSEFIAAAVVSTTSSISFHRLSLPMPEFEDLMADLAGRVLGAAVSATAPVAPAPRSEPETRSRRDDLIAAATTLFAERGFDAVSIDDIGAAVGIAGPSVYNHVASKLELLISATDDGRLVLEKSVRAARGEETDPEAALRRICDDYVDLALARSEMISTLITETRHLPDEVRTQAQKDQVRYIHQWVSLIREIRPDEDVTTARIKVQAAQMLANSIGRTGYLQGRPGLRLDLAEICWILLR